MKVLILGETGMLGNAVYKYFKRMECDIETLPTGTRWFSEEMQEIIKQSTADAIINCIGSIPQKNPDYKDFFEINTRLPLFLFTLRSKMILQAATDCEFSGKITPDKFYSENDKLDAEDLYGISKAIPAEYIKSSAVENVKMIRASIVGIEEKSNASLLNWFLASVKNENSITGYSNHYWNGITTLEWAKIAYDIVTAKLKGNIFHVASEKVSKYQLLKAMANIFAPGYPIAEVEHTKPHNKCLSSKMDTRKIETMLQELKEFYNIEEAKAQKNLLNGE